MDFIVKINRFLFLIVLLCCLSACSDNDGKGGKGKQAFPPQRFSGDLKVRIIPEPATVVTDLQAVYNEGGVITFSWERNGQPVPGATGPVKAKGMFVRGDTVTVIVRANGREGRATATIVNSPPTIQSVTLDPVNIHAGSTVTANATASDADGDEVRFQFAWAVNGQSVTDKSPTLSGEKFRKGDQISLIVTPFDSFGAGPEFVCRPIVVPPGLPEIVSTPPSASATGTYVYEVRAVHPDGDVITYSLGNAPAGMTINSRTGRLEWRLDKGAAGDHIIEVIAQDSNGSRVVQRFNLPVIQTEELR